jgi:predicted transposase/invertase (TIGR01784 family)
MNLNKNHKNSVFSTLFSTPEALRELYSAIEGIDIPPEAIISINTLSDVLFMEKINDISFTIDDKVVVLIEHQSTINNNVPLRLLMYIARVYEKIIDRKKLYNKKLIKIPSPEFIVLYNGKEPYPDHQELKLSTAFKSEESINSLELTVQIYNINHGCNPKILEKSKILGSYSLFVEKIREYNNEKTLEESVKAAIIYCIDNNILKGFFRVHASEVLNMLITEWNTDDAIAVAREEGWEDGWEEGRENERKYVLELFSQGLSSEEIKQRLIQPSN